MKTLHQPEFREMNVMLNGGPQSQTEMNLIALLQRPLFDSREGQTSEAAAKQSYKRLSALNELIRLSPTDIKNVTKRLLSAHELTTLVDGTLTTVMTIHFNLCLGTIIEHGDAGAVEAFVQELLSMQTVGVFLATELGYGNNIVSLKTEAVYDANTREFVINTGAPEAQKFMPNTGADGVPKLAVVMARLKVGNADHGVFPFIVRIRDKNGNTLPGIRVTPLGEKPGYALDNAITSFTNVRIPFHHALLGKQCRLDANGGFASEIQSRRKRFLQAMDRVQAGKLCLSACATKGAQASLQIALRYSAQRKTFAPGRSDVPILQYSNQQKALFSALADTVATTLMYRKAHALLQQRKAHDDLSVNRYVALTKVQCTYLAQATALTCREKIGAQGLFSINKIIGFSNQVHGTITAEGDNQILLIKAAREMLMGEDYLAPRRSRRILRRYNLNSVADQQALLRERERSLHSALRRKMAAARLLKRDLFDTWNENINEAIAMATASAQRLMHEHLCERLSEVRSSAERDALKNLTLLFGLNQISAQSGWFLAQRLLSRRQFRGIERGVHNLLQEIAPVQPMWVRSFMIPDAVLRSPLLSRDYVAAYDQMTSEIEHQHQQAVGR